MTGLELESMKLLHISDTHGRFDPLKLEGVDVIVHSGDFYPDYHDHRPSDKQRTARWQRQWLLDNRNRFVEWTQELPYLYVAGNHDFCDDSWLQENMGNTTNLGYLQVPYDVGGVLFMGYPYVPWISSWWNNELDTVEMRNFVGNWVKEYNKHCPDVLVTHGPAAAVLDNERRRFGCNVLRNAIDYTMRMKPLLHLHGHIHEANGFHETKYEGGVMVTSNAATVQHHITVQQKSRVSGVVTDVQVEKAMLCQRKFIERRRWLSWTKRCCV